MKEIVDVVCYNESIVFAGNFDECDSMGKGHRLSGGVGECGNAIDDVAVDFGPRFLLFELLIYVSSESTIEHSERGFV